MSEKANKHALVEAESRLNDYFKPIMQLHDKRILKNQTILEDTKNKLDEL